MDTPASNKRLQCVCLKPWGVMCGRLYLLTSLRVREPKYVLSKWSFVSKLTSTYCWSSGLGLLPNLNNIFVCSNFHLRNLKTVVWSNEIVRSLEVFLVEPITFPPSTFEIALWIYKVPLAVMILINLSEQQ